MASTTVQSREVVEQIRRWLTQVLSWKPEAKIQRSEVYEAYLKECTERGIEPTSNAAFGKLVKEVFPKVGSTRLGQRGKNKMHYVNLEWACRLRPEEREGSSTMGAPGLVWIEENPLGRPQGGNSARHRRPACTSPALSARTKRRTKPRGKKDESDSNKQDERPESLADHVVTRTTATPQPSTTVTAFSAEGSSVVVGGAPSNNAAPTVRGWAGSGGHYDEHKREILSQAQALAQALQRLWRGGPEVHDPRARPRLNKRKSQREEDQEEEEEEEWRGTTNTQQVAMRRVRGNRQLLPLSPMELHRVRLLERDRWIAGVHLANGDKISRYIETYDREMSEIVPLNPKCTDQAQLLRVLHTSDGTPLNMNGRLDALTTYTLLTMSSFLDGDIEVAREFFHKARDALADVFDVTQYDVAAALVAMAWWARFYAESFEEGVHKQIYYSTLGISTCEALGAINDSAYNGFLLFLSQHGMQSPINRIAQAKQAQPYARQWAAKAKGKKPAKQQSPLLFELCAVHGDVLHHWDSFYLAGRLPDPSNDSAGVLPLLRGHLEHVADIFRRLPPESDPSGNSLPAQSYNLIKSLGLGTRVLILVLLSDPQQLQAAKELVRHLVSIPHQMRIICLHEMASNDYLIPRNAVRILGSCGEVKCLWSFFGALEGFRAKFYWMRQVCTFVTHALEPFNTDSRPPVPSRLPLSAPTPSWPPTPQPEPQPQPAPQPSHQSNHPTATTTATTATASPHVEAFLWQGSDVAAAEDLELCSPYADGDEGLLAPRGGFHPAVVPPMEASTQLPRGGVIASEDQGPFLASDECGVPLPPLFDNLVDDDGSLSSTYRYTTSPADSFDSSAGPGSPSETDLLALALTSTSWG